MTDPYQPQYWLEQYCQGRLKQGPLFLIEAFLEVSPKASACFAEYLASAGSNMDYFFPDQDYELDGLLKLLNRIAKEKLASYPVEADFEAGVKPFWEKCSRAGLEKPALKNMNEMAKKTMQLANLELPLSVHHSLNCSMKDLNWEYDDLGTAVAHIWQDENAGELWAFRAKAGLTTPAHGHAGREWALVLQGGYKTDEGHFKTGDLHIADEKITHQPIMDEDEDCFCLIFSEGKPENQRSALAMV